MQTEIAIVVEGTEFGLSRACPIAMLLYCVVTNLDIFSVYGLLFPCRSSEMNPGVAVEITQNDSTLVKDMWFLIAHTHLYKNK